MINRVLIFLLVTLLLLTGCNPGQAEVSSPAVPQPTLTLLTMLPATLPATPGAFIPTRTLSPAPPTAPVPTATTAPTVVRPTALPQLLLGRGSCFVYDGERGEVLAFGGLLSGTFDASNQTWAWDGQTWKQHHPKTTPPARVDAAMVYDSARKQVVLFGGSQMNGPAFGDMWIWDGENWTEQKPSQLPSPRTQPLMVYDTAQNEIFLFGGYIFDENLAMRYFNETWIFDGQTWTKRNPAHTPSGSDGVPHPIMTYDAARKQPVILEFGGGTWGWTGNDWNQLLGADQSPVDIEGQLGYDETSRRVLLWGRNIFQGHELPPQTWLFDGQAWARANESEHGPDSPEFTILYDFQRQRLFMFAFIGVKTSIPSLSIWEWTVTGWHKVY